MKFTITNVETKQTHEFDSKAFRQRLASFLLLFERDKTDEEKDAIFARFELARQSNAIALYESNGFRFAILPERR